MKVSGPKGPGPATPPSGEAPDEAASPSETSFRELLSTPAAGAAKGPLDTELQAIHARLRAGEIDAARATELLVEAVVRAQLPRAAPVLQEQLRAALQKLLREDPVLSAKLRRIAEEDR